MRNGQECYLTERSVGTYKHLIFVLRVNNT